GKGGIDLRVAGLESTVEVQVTNRVERRALARGRDAWRAGQIQDRFAAPAQRHALIRRRQEAAAPINRAPTGTARAALQHDEPRKVVALAADAVRHPRAHAGTSELPAARVHVKLCGRVIK